MLEDLVGAEDVRRLLEAELLPDVLRQNLLSPARQNNILGLEVCLLDAWCLIGVHLGEPCVLAITVWSRHLLYLDRP